MVRVASYLSIITPIYFVFYGCAPHGDIVRLCTFNGSKLGRPQEPDLDGQKRRPKSPPGRHHLDLNGPGFNSRSLDDTDFDGPDRNDPDLKDPDLEGPSNTSRRKQTEAAGLPTDNNPHKTTNTSQTATDHTRTLQCPQDRPNSRENTPKNATRA